MASTDEVIKNIQKSLSYFFELRGLDNADAKAASDYVGLKLCQQFQGDQVRIKKPGDNNKARNKKIKHMYNGTNMAEVKKRFNVSDRTVYRVIKQKQKASL